LSPSNWTFSVLGHERNLPLIEIYTLLSKESGIQNVYLLSSVEQILLNCSEAKAKELQSQGFILQEITQPIEGAQVPTVLGEPITTSLEISRLTLSYLFNQAGITGRGVLVGVLDSGIISHPCFQNRIVAKEAFITDTPEARHSHGVLITSILGGFLPEAGIWGIAPECFIESIKVLDDEIHSNTATLLLGIDKALKDGCQVLNCSWGNPPSSPPEKDPLVLALRQAIKKGSLVITTVGNLGCTILSPAFAPDIGGVGTCFRNGKIPLFSSRGSSIICVSYGVNIAGASVEPGFLGSGGSFSVPQVAGVGTLLKQLEPRITQYDFLMLAPYYARKPWGIPKNWDGEYGWGITYLRTLMRCL